ncbi:hypothetical protein P4S72_02060 [Vibrio sp. PP-XX7]
MLIWPLRGVQVERVMGSCATDLQGGFGGFQGRALRKWAINWLSVHHQLVHNQHGRHNPVAFYCHSSIHPSGYCKAPSLRISSPSAQHGFVTQQWQVSPASNRMGFRIQASEALTRTRREDLLSHGVFPGVIQVLPARAN